MSTQKTEQIPAWISEIAKYPLCIELEKVFSQIDVECEQTQERWSHWKFLLFNEYCRAEYAFKKSKPRAVVIVQGYEPRSAILRHIAISTGTPAIAFENTFLKDRILWDCCSLRTPNQNLAKNWFWRFESLVDKKTILDFSTHLIQSCRNRKRAEHISPIKTNSQLSIDGEFALFLGQVYTDSSILYSIGSWQTPENAIVQFIRSCQSRRLTPVIKLHPKEFSGTAPITGQPYEMLTWRKLMQSENFRSLMSNQPKPVVDFENQFDTYQLLAQAKVAVTITSQSGLEAAIRGVPVIVCGKSFYSGLGFTRDAFNPAHFEQFFEDAVVSGRSESDVLLAREFAYVFLDRYSREKSSASVIDLVKAVLNGPEIWA